MKVMLYRESGPRKTKVSTRQKGNKPTIAAFLKQVVHPWKQLYKPRGQQAAITSPSHPITVLERFHPRRLSSQGQRRVPVTDIYGHSACQGCSSARAMPHGSRRIGIGFSPRICKKGLNLSCLFRTNRTRKIRMVPKHSSTALVIYNISSEKWYTSHGIAARNHRPAVFSVV